MLIAKASYERVTNGDEEGVLKMGRNNYDPYKTLMDIRRRMNELVKHGLTQMETFGEVRTDINWDPAFDIVETDEAYLVYGELPGLKKKEIHIVLKGAELTVFGERRPESVESTATYHQAERYYGHFERSFRLSGEIEEEGVATSLNNGLLEIRLPKRKARTIPIQ